MVLFLHDTIAVHDSNSGARLWENEIDEEDRNFRNNGNLDSLDISYSIFITKVITGYLRLDFRIRRLSPGEEDRSKLHIYDTDTGEFIAGIKTSSINLDRLHYWLMARGPFLCYRSLIKREVINVLHVVGKKTKFHTVVFPLDHFKLEQLRSFKRIPSDKMTIWYLLGFLGKSNILLGSVGCPDDGGPELFSLDLDAAIAARNDQEVARAFSLPLSKNWIGNTCSVHQKDFHPIYRTDRERGCVDLVGVMRETDTVNTMGDKLTFGNCFFVTDMEFSRDF